MARKRPDRPPPAHRPIVPDHELWTRLKQTVTPLDPRRAEPEQPASATPVAKPEIPAPKQPSKKPAKMANTATAPVPPPVAPALTGLDRRTSQRLARGQIEVDDRIDLHGQNIESARIKLKSFLNQARTGGARTVLVITGKGFSDFARHTLHGSTHFHAPERQGHLRRMATQWFQDAEFSHLISGYQPAHPKHGGGGAFYVRLRRADKRRKSP